MKKKRLVYEDRKVIERMLEENCKKAEIAIFLNCSRATIYRELNRGLDLDTGKYSAEKAQLSLFGK